MFRRFCCSGKKSTDVIELVKYGRLQASHTSSSSQCVSVSDILLVTKKDEKTLWMNRLFGRPLKKENHLESKKQSVDTSGNRTTKKAAKAWWRRFVGKKKKYKVVTSTEEEEAKEERISTTHQDEPLTLEDYEEAKKQPQRDQNSIIQSTKEEEVTVPSSKTLRQQQISCLGFPNPYNNCYLNSCLQSILTLEDFIKDITNQQEVWRISPGVNILRSLMDIKKSYFSHDGREKLRSVLVFKKVVSMWNSEFTGLQQKDAHEFLMSVLQLISELDPQLQELAATTDKTYSCPVKNHVMFKMQNRRKCRSCAKDSVREEDFTILSLDLLPGCTIQQMLEEYMKETEFEYTCDCGGTISDQCSSFIDLPRTLILHLKRFSYSPTFKFIKKNDPIILSRDIVVPSRQGGGCYSLVSTINHIGRTATSGHYICDGVDPDVSPEETTDRWFSYNDALVAETDGAFICNLRQTSSYILFYKKNVIT